MYAIETWTKGVTDKKKQTKGWLSKFQIWKLKDLPTTEEFRPEREACLVGLKSKDNEAVDRGKAYYYAHSHAQETESCRARVITAHAKAKIQKEEDWQAITDGLDADFNSGDPSPAPIP